jgi:hypothetical protein
MENNKYPTVWGVKNHGVWGEGTWIYKFQLVASPNARQRAKKFGIFVCFLWGLVSVEGRGRLEKETPKTSLPGHRVVINLLVATYQTMWGMLSFFGGIIALSKLLSSAMYYYLLDQCPALSKLTKSSKMRLQSP